MPSQETMKAAMQAYIDAFNRADTAAILALYAPDATVEDPVGSPVKHGIAEMGFTHVGVTQIGFGQVCANQIRAP